MPNSTGMRNDVEPQQQTWGEELRRISPYGRTQYVDVTFALANTDTAIAHQIKVSDSNDVRYQVVRKDRACDVYEDFSPNRRAWSPNTIYLKCDTAGAQVRLLLFTERFKNA